MKAEAGEGIKMKERPIVFRDYYGSNPDWIEKIEPPKEFKPQNVMYWEPKSQTLLRQKKDGNIEAATLLTKAQTFLENNCIQLAGADKFICKPIEGYNKTTYQINDVIGEYRCNCQGYNKNGFCSHVLAVKQFVFIGK